MRGTLFQGNIKLYFWSSQRSIPQLNSTFCYLVRENKMLHRLSWLPLSEERRRHEYFYTVEDARLSQGRGQDGTNSSGGTRGLDVKPYLGSWLTWDIWTACESPFNVLVTSTFMFSIERVVVSQRNILAGVTLLQNSSWRSRVNANLSKSELISYTEECVLERRPFSSPFP